MRSATPVILSILVPTHNRQRYAIPTVEALISHLPDSEVVVCDTSDVDLFSAELERWNAKGSVKLVRPRAERPLTVVDNFRHALEHASGTYVVFIGDDDFVHSSAEDIAWWAQGQGVEAVRCTFPASYYWPDFSSRYFGAGYASKLAINAFKAQVREVQPIDEYRAALANLGAGVLKMPRAYLGMISRGLAQRICQKHGNLFGGVSPDIYSAALIANEARSCMEIDFPFVVPGSSGASTSGQSAKGAHKGGLRDNAHIGPFVDLCWDDRVPEFYSVPTVWSYSLLKAAESLGDDHKANFGRLYAKCLLGHPDYLAETLRAMRAQARRTGIARTAASLLAGLCAEMAAQFARVARRLSSGRKATARAFTIEGIANCSQASAALSRYIAEHNTRRSFPWSMPGATRSNTV